MSYICDINKVKMNKIIENYISERINEFNSITDERKEILSELTDYIRKNNDKDKNLIFICTHNSRRSHMGQLWSQVAAHYYRINNINCFSGGTEETAFNERSVRALKKAGFDIIKTTENDNPVYMVSFQDGTSQIQAFSKKYNHEFNPQENFVAIMTCSQADDDCPVVIGASKKIAITYDDPKIADGTPEEESKYDERSKQIACEMLYVFSMV